MAKMVASNVVWCRHYGKRGKAGDAERRNVKRSERQKVKKEVAREH